MPDKHQVDRDMSEAAINRRMRKLSELYQLWRSVERSRPLNRKNEIRACRGPDPTARPET